MPRRLTNLDLDLVRTFVAIATVGSFTRAAASVRRQQSTISLQIKRLEVAVGKRLLERSPTAVTLTHDGEVFLESAKRLLALNDEVVASVSEPQMHGVVRLGTPEDFATTHLSHVLARFAQAYPAVSLEVTCDLTLNLLERHRKGLFDLTLIKREPTSRGKGIGVWREPLVWVSATGSIATRQSTVPLAVSPAPCVYRKRAIQTLDRAKKPWRLAYTCGSLAGTLAAVRAGLGVTVLPKDMVPEDLRILPDSAYPALLDTEIALLERSKLSPAAEKLKNHIAVSLTHT